MCALVALRRLLRASRIIHRLTAAWTIHTSYVEAGKFFMCVLRARCHSGTLGTTPLLCVDNDRSECINHSTHNADHEITNICGLYNHVGMRR